MYFKTLEAVKQYIKDKPLNEGEELMIFVADNSSFYVNELMEYLNGKSVKFFGGIFAGLLVGSINKSEGFIVNRIQPVFTTMVLPFLMRCNLNFDSLENATAIVLADGLSSKMKDLTDTLYDKFGNKVKYIGGGAGFYSLEHKPCIFNNNGIYTDVLMVSIIESDITIGVKHGWNRLSGPFFVTNSNDNILSELDSDNAFEVYKHIIEETEGVALFKEDFFTYAKDHPFGIPQSGHADIVRDPIMLNDLNEIVCVANIPSHTDLYILHGDSDTLLASSIEVANECISNISYDTYQPLLFNCISRAMFLEEKFEDELNNIQTRLQEPVLGALSIGEIASLNNGQLEIHNKSTVLGLLEKK